MHYFYGVAALFASLAWLIADGYPPWVTVYQETSMCIAIASLAIAMSNKRITIPKLFLPLIIVILIPSLQYLGNVVHYRQDAFISSAYLFLFFLALILGFNLTQITSTLLPTISKSSKQSDLVIQGFLIVIIVTVLINTWIALRQILMLNNGNIWMLDLPVGVRPYGNFGQPNHLATLISMGLIATLIQFETNRISRYIAVLIAIVLIVGSVLTQSRTAWLFAASLPIWWLLKAKNIDLKLSFRYLLAWVSGYIALVITIPYMARLIGLSGFEQYSNRVTAGYERLTMWHQVITAIQYEPFFGYGWGQIRFALMTTVGRFEHATNFESSHNIFLDIIIWNGLPIGLTLIIAILWLIIKIILFKLNKLTFLWLSLAIPIFIHSLLEYPLSYAFFLLPFGFILGIAYGYLKLSISYIYLPVISKVISISVMSISLGLFVYEYISAFTQTQQVRYENAGLADKITYVKSNEINIFTDKFEDYIWFYRLDLNQKLTQKDLERIEHLYKANPVYPVLAKYIHVQYKIGNIKKAKEAEDVIRVFYPKKFVKHS